jgi:Fe-S cluster assembly protein SufD
MTDTIQYFSDYFTQQPDGALQTFRSNALENLKQYGIPGNKHEEWKYTRINTLFQQQLTLGTTSNLAKADLDAFRLPGAENAFELFFINGIFQSDLSYLGDEITVMPLESAAKSAFASIVEMHLGHSSKYHPDGINALNTAFVNGGVFIHIAQGKQIDQPIYIYYINDSRNAATLALPRTLVYVSAAANIQIAEQHVTIGNETSFTNQVTEVIVEKDAVVNFYKIQQEGPNAHQVCTTHFRQIGKSLTNTTTISLSGGLVRNNLNMVMEAEYGESHMFGLYLLDGKTQVDNHTIVDNVMPNCFSNELYKGIMDGDSTGIFNGKIFVRKDAQKTNAYQSNKNILLSDNASANTKPQLEILADDVKCSHGCTIGKLDEEAMFYLRARGIGERNAQALLLHAFAVDILDNIKTAPLRTYIDQLISERLDFNF